MTITLTLLMSIFVIIIRTEKYSYHIEAFVKTVRIAKQKRCKYLIYNALHFYQVPRTGFELYLHMSQNQCVIFYKTTKSHYGLTGVLHLYITMI